ncbi:hypothetical protein [Methylosinus sp. PW1]|uniref:hypothetical protein n=1 Tax=Methylosinus sp. PW1 TaxID=107636 RepID=UPI0012EB6C15|nr:hypothetical protein [Methylosinus sp. PW1]
MLAAPQNAEPKKPKKRGARLVWTLTRKLELANQLDTFRSADPRRAKKGVDALIKDAATKRGQMFDWARQDSSGRLENIVGEVNQWRAKRRNPAVRRLIQAKLRSWSMGSRFSAKRAMRELVAGKKIGADKEAQIMRAAEQLEAINSNPLYREGAVEAISIATGRRLQAFGLILRKR